MSNEEQRFWARLVDAFVAAEGRSDDRVPAWLTPAKLSAMERALLARLDEGERRSPAEPTRGLAPIDLTVQRFREDEIRSAVARAARRIAEEYADTGVVILSSLRASSHLVRDLVRDLEREFGRAALAPRAEVRLLYAAIREERFRRRYDVELELIPDGPGATSGEELLQRRILLVSDSTSARSRLQLVRETLLRCKARDVRTCVLVHHPEFSEQQPDFAVLMASYARLVGYGMGATEQERRLPYIASTQPRPSRRGCELEIPACAPAWFRVARTAWLRGHSATLLRSAESDPVHELDACLRGEYFSWVAFAAIWAGQFAMAEARAEQGLLLARKSDVVRCNLHFAEALCRLARWDLDGAARSLDCVLEYEPTCQVSVELAPAIRRAWICPWGATFSLSFYRHLIRRFFDLPVDERQRDWSVEEAHDFAH